MPKIILANIVAVFWAFIYGEVIGYIASALEVLPYNKLSIGCVAALTTFIAVNGFYLVSRVTKKSSN
ncbi:DUF2929 family protein [Lentilactobacillus sp. Marseille-Q4993]|uniref:DUF2929 family protein n=1 Tax=Lentilactobacillus sp. Marseille-Q4993 TaxID=3039492 RepID=UPI0024BCF0E9|nr:DUF2929 family protein [Lentilactobacillus sp. Marseille-Q4993]